MAKQDGHFPVKGKIGNLTFYRSKDGYLIRDRGGLNASRMATDPAFKRTRENQAEFARAGRAAKLLRNAFKALSNNGSDSRQYSRLVKEMMKVLKSDSVSRRGERNVANGEIEFLRGFQFNIDAPIDTTFLAPFESAIDRVTGSLSVNIQSFVPENSVVIPEGATHFQINAAGAEVDFEEDLYVTVSANSPEIKWDDEATAPISLEIALPANSTKPLFLLLGIVFFQEVNGKMYPLKNGGYNSWTTIMVSGG